MRLQLITIALFTSALAITSGTAAHADQRAATWISVYSDNDSLTVISPQLSVRGDATEQVELSASYEVDVISAATVDVVTAASPRGYTEERHALSLGASWTPEAESSVSLRYVPSWEVDYRSHSFLVGASREWLSRRLTTRLDGRLAFDRVGRSGSDSSTFQALRTSSLRLGLGWIATRWTILEAVYEPQLLRGFMASPYRFVAVQWSDGSTVVAPEAVPKQRVRHAVGLGVRHAFNDQWFLSGKYRLYRDSWGIWSNTGEAELQRAMDWDNLIVGVTLRGYQQTGATFQETSYDAMAGVLPEFRSADKMLTSSWSMLAAARAQYLVGSVAFVEALRVTIKLELYDQHFRDFESLKRRIGQTASLGASAEF